MARTNKSPTKSTKSPLQKKLLVASRDPIWQMVGVAIAVLALFWGVYTFYKGSNSASTVVQSTFLYQVRVKTKDASENIARAKVIIEVRGERVSLESITDSNGIARIFINTSLEGRPGFLIVEATGYVEYTQYIDLTRDNFSKLVELDPAPSSMIATPKPSPFATNTHTPVDSILSSPIGTPVSSSSLEDFCNESNGNGDFQAGWNCWMIEKSPVTQTLPEVVPALTDGSPFDTYSIRLGDPTAKESSPIGPDGYIAVWPAFIQVPMTDAPELRFDYLMYSYDVVASSANGYPYDSFEVAINELPTVIWLTGNTHIDWDGYSSECRPIVWESNSGSIATASINLSPYKSQNIKIYFSLHNRTDRKCNSWVYIDNVRVLP